MAEPAAAQEEEGSEEEAQEAEYEFLGKFRTVIVGVRYYTGRVGVDEMVRFVREPANPHDANAIKVENMRAEQVGHIKRELAAEIARLLDDGSLRIAGIMPDGQTNAYRLPVEVYASGSGPQVAEALRRGIARAGIVLQSMSLAVAMATMQGSGSQSPGSSQGSQRGGYLSLAPQQMESSLQRLFADLYVAAGPKPQMQPAPEVTSPLFQHQHQLHVGHELLAEQAALIQEVFIAAGEESSRVVAAMDHAAELKTPAAEKEVRDAMARFSEAMRLGVATTVTVQESLCTFVERVGMATDPFGIVSGPGTSAQRGASGSGGGGPRTAPPPPPVVVTTSGAAAGSTAPGAGANSALTDLLND